MNDPLKLERRKRQEVFHVLVEEARADMVRTNMMLSILRTITQNQDPSALRAADDGMLLFVATLAFEYLAGAAIQAAESKVAESN